MLGVHACLKRLRPMITGNAAGVMLCQNAANIIAATNATLLPQHAAACNPYRLGPPCSLRFMRCNIMPALVLCLGHLATLRSVVLCVKIYSPSMQASKGFLSILRQLLQHGAKVNAKDNTGSTPLHRAAGSGQAEAVQVLVEEGNAKVDSKDKTGATPLFVAVSCREANIAIYLASRGADVEVSTWLEGGLVG